MATLLQRYVDPNSTAGGNGTTNALSGDNRAYVSLNAWEAATQKDLTASDEYAVVTCSSDDAGSTHAADTTDCAISGWTTDATRYIQIEAASSHGGKWNAGIYRLEVTDNNVLNISEDYVNVIGLQVTLVSPTADGKQSIRMESQTATTNKININKCIVKGANDAYSEYGIYSYSSNANVDIWNSLVYNIGTASGNYATYINNAVSNIYSSTFIGGYTGVRGNTNNIVCKNVYSGGNSGWDYYSCTLTTCASSDDTGSTGLQNISVNTTNFTNVTAGSEDFHLPLGSALIDVGTDTSGDAAPLNFTTDIDDETRSGTWDIGADEYVATDLADVDVTDAVVRSIIFGRIVGESLGVSDYILGNLISGGTTLTLYLSETMGLSDAVVASKVLIRSINETAGISDSAVRMKAMIRLVSDNLSVTDFNAFMRGLVRFMSESVGITDSAVRYKNTVRLISEVVGLTDSQKFGLDLSRIVTESVGMTDFLYRLIAKMIVLSESLGITDSQLRILDAVRQMPEPFDVTDVANRYATFFRQVVDSEGIEDAAQKFSTIPRIISDSLGITDYAYSYLILNQYEIVISESIGVTDFVKGLIVLTRNIAEQFGITDERTIQIALWRVLSEALGITDSIARTIDARRYPTEQVGPMDARTSGIAYLRWLSESLGINDAAVATAALIILRVLTDAMGYEDANTQQRGSGRYVSDSLGVTDARGYMVSAVRSIADSMGITDFDELYKQIVRDLSENVGVPDSVEKIVAYIRKIEENAGLSDSLISGIVQLRTICEYLGITDEDTWSILSALYLSIAISAKSKRITLSSTAARITLEVE